MTEWVKNRQSLVFHAEVDNLPSKLRHRTTLVSHLRLFLDDGGLLRCCGRIHSGTLKWKHQISSAATRQRPLHRSSNSLHPCQTASCRCQFYTVNSTLFWGKGGGWGEYFQDAENRILLPCVSTLLSLIVGTVLNGYSSQRGPLGMVGFWNASPVLPSPPLRGYSAELQSTCALFKQLLLK